MATELHIQLFPGVVGLPEDILSAFPFGEGQSIVSFAGGVIIVDLSAADDTTYEQDWFLNGNDEVQSFYIVED
jgi:hypothetical protein